MGCQTITQFKKRLYVGSTPIEQVAVEKCTSYLYSTFPDHLERDWVSVSDACIFMEPSYLRAVQTMNDPMFGLRMLMVYKEGRPVLTASFNITGFIANDLKGNLHGRNRLIRTLSSAVRQSGILNKRRILICGSAFSTGEHAFFYTRGISGEDAAEMVLQAMDEIIKEEEAKGIKIAAVLIKDFFPRSRRSLRPFEDKGFRAFEVDHNMVMPVLSEWITFDDYLMSMNSKFRTKAKSVLNKSAALTVRDINAEEIRLRIPELKILFDNVVGNADFSLGKMDLSCLPDLHENMRDDFICRVFEYEGKIVGFLTTMMNKTCVEAHLVGIDYSWNKQLAIYNRMLLEYVRIGIENRKNMIFFSRTASEIKSTVGAFPVEMTCLIRHPGRLGNFFVNLLFSYVKASQSEQRDPYLQSTKEKVKKMLESFYPK